MRRYLPRSRVVRVLAGCLTALLVTGGLVGGCGGSEDIAGADWDPHAVVADTSFLADIAQSIAGDRFAIGSLIPEKAEPYSFEPSTGDARTIAQSRAVIIEAAGAALVLVATAIFQVVFVVAPGPGLVSRIARRGPPAPAGPLGPRTGLSLRESRN